MNVSFNSSDSENKFSTVRYPKYVFWSSLIENRSFCSLFFLPCCRTLQEQSSNAWYLRVINMGNLAIKEVQKCSAVLNYCSFNSLKLSLHKVVTWKVCLKDPFNSKAIVLIFKEKTVSFNYRLWESLLLIIHELIKNLALS